MTMDTINIAWIIFGVIYFPILFIGCIMSAMKACKDRARIKKKNKAIRIERERKIFPPHVVFIEDEARKIKWAGYDQSNNTLDCTDQPGEVTQRCNGGPVNERVVVTCQVEQHQLPNGEDRLDRHYLSESDLAYLHNHMGDAPNKGKGGKQGKHGVANPAGSFNDLHEESAIELKSMSVVKGGVKTFPPNATSPTSPSDSESWQAINDPDTVSESDPGHDEASTSPEKSPERLADPTTKLLSRNNDVQPTGDLSTPYILVKGEKEPREKPPRQKPPGEHRKLSLDNCNIAQESVDEVVHQTGSETSLNRYADYGDKPTSTSSRNQKNYPKTVHVSPGGVQVLVKSSPDNDVDDVDDTLATDSVLREEEWPRRRRLSSAIGVTGDRASDSGQDDTAPERSQSDYNLTTSRDPAMQNLSVYGKGAVNEAFVKSTEHPML